MNRPAMRRLGVLVLAIGGVVGLAACRPIEAQIRARPFGGPPPLEVEFDASETSPQTEIASYEWDFGDGASGVGRIVTHTYPELGEYRVKLTARKTPTYNGSDGWAYQTIYVTNGPNVSFVATPSPTDPLTVDFDGSATTPPARQKTHFIMETAVIGWLEWLHAADEIVWDFGDGTTETWTNTLANLTLDPTPFLAHHTYTTPGTYTVSLTVTDTLQLIGAFEVQVVVGGGEAPPPDVSEDFTVVSSFWQVTDEEDDPEQECLDIWGTVRNDGSVAAGCELTATAFDAQGNPVGAAANWAVGSTNITPGATVPFSFYHCALAVTPSQVARVDVTVTDARSW